MNMPGPPRPLPYKPDPPPPPDPRTDNDDNLLYSNNNPEGDPCPICAPDIGRVFAPGTEPHVPRHPNCYCYYVPTKRSPSPPR